MRCGFESYEEETLFRALHFLRWCCNCWMKGVQCDISFQALSKKGPVPAFCKVGIPLLCFLGQLKGCSPDFLGGLGKVVPNFCILVGLGWIRHQGHCTGVVLLKCREKERETREEPSDLGSNWENMFWEQDTEEVGSKFFVRAYSYYNPFLDSLFRFSPWYLRYTWQ